MFHNSCTTTFASSYVVFCFGLKILEKEGGEVIEKGYCL